MKKLFALLALSLLFAGFLGAAPEAGAAGIPNLVGTWTGTNNGVHINGNFFTESITMVVQEQNGSLFYGNITLPGPRTIYFTGAIMSNNTVQMTVRQDTEVVSHFTCCGWNMQGLGTTQSDPPLNVTVFTNFNALQLNGRATETYTIMNGSYKSTLSGKTITGVVQSVGASTILYKITKQQ